MPIRLIKVLVASVLATSACQYRSTPVQLQGLPTELQSLAGEWDGRYGGAPSGREGSIWMRVAAHADSAFGDVQMLNYAGVANRPAHDADQHRLHAPSAETLRIVFVRVSGGTIFGALEPYVAPDCSCRVTTTFTGQITNQGIEGTFVTRGELGSEQQGWWKATRRKSR